MGMVVGVLLCRPIAALESWSGNTITPALISMMLFFTFCRVDIRQMRPSRMHLWLLLFQLIGAVAAYYACMPFGQVMAQGAMVCVLAPIAMAAVVIGGMLGANIATMATYSLICNFVIAVFAPLMLHAYGNGDCTFGQIAMKIAPLLIMPFVAGQACRHLFRRLTQWISDHSQISFYMWLISLAIVIGRTTCFILDTDADSGVEIRLAAAALVICLIRRRPPLGPSIRRHGRRRSIARTEEYRSGRLDGTAVPRPRLLRRPHRLHRVAEFREQLSNLQER